jgi:hypothetical protein
VAKVTRKTGVVAVLAKRMTEERLPRALAIKERVDRGEELNDLDLAFLEQVLADARGMGALMESDPKVHDVAGRMLQLYREITNKALQNQQAGKGA